MNDFLGNLTALSWETHGVRLILGWYGLVCGDGRGPWLCPAARRSAALVRFCHRWNRSATWIASRTAAGGV